MNPSVSITKLERDFQELAKEWERFFGGVVRTPPEKQRAAYGRQLRRLSEDGGLSSTDQFRLQQLQHKFSTYAAMWERMLREREEGRGRSLAHLRAASRAAATPPPAPRANAARARSVDKGKGDDLYETFMSAKKRLGQSSSLKRDAFEAQLESQRRQIETRLGHKVRFEVVVEGDKVKLTARKRGGSEQE
jgi:hypothetical protein